MSYLLLVLIALALLGALFSAVALLAASVRERPVHSARRLPD